MPQKDLKFIRKARLGALIKEYGGQKELAEELGVEPNYISQLLRPEKSFGERSARNIERKTRKAEGWLDSADDLGERPTEWPFSFDRAFWDRLSPAQKRDIENTLRKLILGTGVEEMATPALKRRRL